MPVNIQDLAGNNPALAALFRVPIPYVLEVLVDGKVARTISVPHYPQGITFQQPQASAVRHTAGSEPVRENTRNRTWLIGIRGNSGYKARAGYDRRGHVIYRNGPEIVREFGKFLNDYQEMSEGQEDRVKLVFRAIKEGYAYESEVLHWSRTWDHLRSTVTDDWQVQLRGYAEAGIVRIPSLLSPVSDWFEAAAESIRQVNDYAAVIQNAGVNLRADLDVLRAPLQALQQSGQVLQGVLESARAIARFPAVLLADFANVAVAFLNAWDSLVGDRATDPLGVNGWTALRSEWDLLVRRVGYSAEDSARQATEAAGYGGVGGADTASAETRRSNARATSSVTRGLRSRPQSQQSAALQVTLRQGEDLQDVAQRVYGDPDRATDLAQFNNWPTFSRRADGRPAREGDVVLAPGLLPSETAAPEKPAVDIFRTSDNDLEFTPGGDIRKVKGQPAFRQALLGRMLTTQGESEGFPQFGLPLVTGSALTPQSASLLASHLQAQVLRDDRVKRVEQMEVVQDGDRLLCAARLILQDASSVPLETLIPFPAG